MDVSPGRVQSAALRLVCEREAAIEAFKPCEYWSVEVTLRTAAGVSFQVMVHLGKVPAAPKLIQRDVCVGQLRVPYDPQSVHRMSPAGEAQLLLSWPSCCPRVYTLQTLQAD